MYNTLHVTEVMINLLAMIKLLATWQRIKPQCLEHLSKVWSYRHLANLANIFLLIKNKSLTRGPRNPAGPPPINQVGRGPNGQTPQQTQGDGTQCLPN